MTGKIEPALTPKEWTGVLEACDGNGCASADVASLALAGRFGAAAAVALHGQPFGFTQDDVSLLLGMVRDHGDEFGDLAARIEALLMPEGSE